MNEQEQIEQTLLQLAPPKAPAGLRTTVLDAIERQRESDAQARVLTAKADDRRWLATLDRTATFAAPCLLAISLLVFVIVERSADKLYGGHRDSVSQAQRAATDAAFAEKEPPMTPQAFFRQHLAILQNLNAELFSEASKKVPQVDGDRPPLSHFRRHPDGRVAELASLTQSRGTFSTLA
ncbi:hypothetical protein [Novipirellula artificiosorum]|uniref:Uncharacterized protein n=1 Tax=Novipirellula artificiosorum TaxID=2528016 RepID=A0A5C6DXS5_9BACT|nr:hypothetical protein [Novipirellula artificiosorum]TWU42243.1 hypothetical protein Poly41_05390 [Novipirellula artificiosorum]